MSSLEDRAARAADGSDFGVKAEATAAVARYIVESLSIILYIYIN